MRFITFTFVMLSMAASAVAQGIPGFVRFSGRLNAVREADRRVDLDVQVLTSRLPVYLDEHTTVTGSLGGRTSSRSLGVGQFVEIQGFFQNDGQIRASEVEIKVQSGALRMTGRIENILSIAGRQSMIVNGAEFLLDEQTIVVAPKDGIAVTAKVSDLKTGIDVDVTGTYLSEEGAGPSTAGLFHADRILANRTFRIQGTVRSRVPSTGNPTVIVVHGIVVTLTPETAVASNGMNERNEALMPRDTSAVVIGIEDDAGNPCQNTPQKPDNDCPDVAPRDPAAAGEIQLGSFVRVEGILEDTGFSSRYTARAIQIEKPREIRFEGVVESRDATSITVKLADSIRTRVLLDRVSQVEGSVAVGQLIEVTAQFGADLSLLGRRIKTR